MKTRKILFVSSEVAPLVKTGGLADVSSGLPKALKALNKDIRIVMPAYRETLRKADKITFASTSIEGVPPTVRLLESQLPDSSVKLYLVDSPSHFDRPGSPYLGPNGHDWPDNAERFTIFSNVAIAIATNSAGLNWQPEVVHCNDWQSGPVPALLSLKPERPATVFTIHNLSYQGMFPWHTFQGLRLPKELWTPEGMEYFGGFSFIKGGLSYADMISTVSPTYAKEIQTPEFAYGLEGLLSSRRSRLKGIINGADYETWNPQSDPLIPTNYDAGRFVSKHANKALLQEEMNLPKGSKSFLLGFIGRLVDQKGIDLIVDILPDLLKKDIQLVVLGSGENRHEQSLLQTQKEYPRKVAVMIGYDEALAHRIEAGTDAFLMPSRFEPCGLNQLYSLRYGTPPIVHATGGLADTICDATPDNLKKKNATGFVFTKSSAESLHLACERAYKLFQDSGAWKTLAQTGMSQDYGWKRSAQDYLSLYSKAREHSKVISA